MSATGAEQTDQNGRLGLHPDHKIAGVLAPLFALRGKNDLGVGDLGALREFVDWAANHGLRLVQILPVNETGADNSPYNAISSTALDPLTIATTPLSLRDLHPADRDAVLAQYDVERLQSGPVDYPTVKRLKLALMEKAFATFERERTAARLRKHAAFQDANSEWLPGYTLFRVLIEEQGHEQWDRWPEDRRKQVTAEAWLAALPPAEKERIERRRRFFAYVQEIAFDQWGKLLAYAGRKGVAIMGDVPIGVSYYSSDVFADQGGFDLEWSGGAPPERVFQSDPFTEKWGQNWGVPLYRWAKMREDNYSWWRRRVRIARKVFHLFRIDHILGFYRIYSFPWRPQRNGEFLNLTPDQAKAKTGGRLPGFIPRDDLTPENAWANRAGGEALLRVLLEEAGDFRLVGEDLGVVPDYVRPSLLGLGIAGFKIPQWERTHDNKFIPGSEYPRLSVATYATHDHPPLRVIWEEWSKVIAAFDAGDTTMRDRAGHDRWEMRCLLEFAHTPREPRPAPYDASIREELLGGLFDSNSWIALVMITDLLGFSDRFNVPGSVASSNWSHRLPGKPADWEKDDALASSLRRITDRIRASGRLG